MQTKPVEISQTDDGTRLLRWFLRKFPSLPNREFYRLCRSGQIRINSKRCRGQEILRAGDVIRIPPHLNKFAVEKVKKTESGDHFSLAELEELRICIIHDDPDIVVFNKPAGLAVQGGTGIRKSVDKMAAALFPYDRISLVHRLDRETSGVLIVAKNHNAAQNLTEQFANRIAKKEYLALLSGDVNPKNGIIDNLMIKGKIVAPGDATPDGQRPVRAITEYRVLSTVPGILSWVLFMPQTGRTHQLRMHSAFSLNAPIVGDQIYGGDQNFDSVLGSMLSTKNLFLFAYRLSFRHPTSKKTITIHAKMPEFMQSVIGFLEFEIPE